MQDIHADVIIVGAGISGISAAHYLQQNPKTKHLSYTVLERRSRIGGTWDLFKYPGIRSDSDMYTFCFPFKPWDCDQRFGNGDEIQTYMEDTARELGIAKKIVFGRTVLRADWSDSGATWTLSLGKTSAAHDGSQWAKPRDGEDLVEDRTEHRAVCKYLIMGTGYYSYADPHWPAFPGQEDFQGRIVHPQFWDPSLSFKDKEVVVIGSGATAVTLIPSMAKEVKHITMLQRSATYMAPLPNKARVFNFVSYLVFLPAFVRHFIVRWILIMISFLAFHVSRRFPNFMRHVMLKAMKKQLGPEHAPENMPHFTPSYKPWDQRVCVIPDGDLPKAIRAGKASVVTAKILRFNHEGIELDNGSKLRADIIVPATGLTLLANGGIRINVNGVPILPSETYTYRGAMYTGIPNFFSITGYLNASWSMKAALIAEYAARIIAECEKKGCASVTPRHLPGEAIVPGLSLPDAHGFTSSYFQRSKDQLPKQGTQQPFQSNQNYLLDLKSLYFSSVNEKHLFYTNAVDAKKR